MKKQPTPKKEEPVLKERVVDVGSSSVIEAVGYVYRQPRESEASRQRRTGWFDKERSKTDLYTENDNTSQSGVSDNAAK